MGLPALAQSVRRADPPQGKKTMRREAKISIITPVWNGMPYLQECVESVLRQDFEDWELLISDDGSTDGSRNWLDTLNDPRIRIFKQERNLGIFDNLNFLFRNASAPLSQILCQDDYLFDIGALGRIIQLWADAPSRVGFIRENWRDANTTETDRWGKRHLPSLIEPQSSDLVFFVFGCIAGNLSNITLRTSLIGETGWFDQRLPYAGDYQFWCRAGRRAAFLLEGSNLTFVRQHAGQATFHLNRHGELVVQLYAVVGDLFERLKGKLPQALLRIHSTMHFDAFQRAVAVRKWLATGNRQYLSHVNAAGARQAVFLSAPLRWVVFVLSGGGRWGSSITAQKLFARQTPSC
jgi:glycosyltransferase involved in cell wall biosynthesis